MEVEAEGKYGWAEKMPTWYRINGWVPRFYILLMGGGRPLTGYHFFLIPLQLMIFHIGFITGAPWSISAECHVLSLLFAFIIMWDYIWFVLNPFYGARNFRKNKVWWFSKSYWVNDRIPLEYIGAIILSLVFAALSGSLFTHFIKCILWIVFIGVTVMIAPYYHRWYKSMRNRDDREQAGIFHDKD